MQPRCHGATVTRPRRRRAGNAWAGQVHRVDLCTHRACRASVARATVLCMYRCVYIRILSTTRSYRSRRSSRSSWLVLVARASRHVSRSRLQISDYVDGGGSGGRPIERAWYLSSAIRSGSAHCPAPASQARHSGAGKRHRHPHTASKHVRIGPITIHMGGITMHSQRERHGYSYVSVRRMCNTKGEQEP